MRPQSPPAQNRMTRPAWQIAYLKWMQKVNHPDLAKSNYHADRFRYLQTGLSGTP